MVIATPDKAELLQYAHRVMWFVAVDGRLAEEKLQRS